MAELDDVARAVRLRAELALVRRLNAGAGFADGRGLAQVYLRDDAALARIAGPTLRPQGSHRKAAAELTAAIAALPPAGARIATGAQRLGLGAVARAILDVTLAYAIDLDTRELAHALAPRRRPALYAETIAEIAALEGAEVVRALTVGAPLRRGRLLLVDGDGLGATIEISPAALAWLAGDDAIGPPLAAICALDGTPTIALPDGTTAATDAVTARVRELGAADVAITIRGPRGAGRRAVAQRIARTLARPLLVVHVAQLVALERRTRAALLANLVAAARIRDAVIYLEEVDALYDERGELALDHRDALASIAGLVIASTPHRGHVELHRPQLGIAMPRMELADRERAWQTAISSGPLDDAQAAIVVELAARYVIGPGAIADVVGEARRYADAAGTPLDLAALEAAVGRRLTMRLGTYGTVVHRKARFAELVLPHDVVDTLHDMVAMVRERTRILEQWGYQRHLGISRGVAGLFSGEPGTGKTMAASVVASELGLELVRIDLSAVVSKFVGETEKNLGKIFDEAQDAHAMLLFDEADSLFGKRTELKSAQDRFANLVVNYLLQRMETFDGVSVLTTNAEAAIDPALQRRLNFRVRFPEPEPEERAQLWRRLLPPGTGLHAVVDFEALADKFDMTGGYIKNAVVRAAVIAARANRALTVDDLWMGAHHEYVEMGKVMPQLAPSR
ncbi:MAG: ATP-binding protein [Proteobacteria bacterium]|nr:ATP-binding protein [Pseudomonadota bacterium]